MIAAKVSEYLWKKNVIQPDSAKNNWLSLSVKMYRNIVWWTCSKQRKLATCENRCYNTVYPGKDQD